VYGYLDFYKFILVETKIEETRIFLVAKFRNTNLLLWKDLLLNSQQRKFKHKL